MFQNALHLFTIAWLSSQVFATFFVPLNGNIACNSRPTKAKYIKIVSPKDIQERCTYTVQKHNSQTCQLLVKFVEFNSPQPVTTRGGDGSPSKTCTEFLDINGMVICGNNSGQHLYIPMDSSNEVSFQFHGVRHSSWNLQVTQLECPSTLFRLPSSDSHLIAPTNCNQYFSDSRGRIESFNFNGGSGVYPSNLNYAICIKRPSTKSTLQLNLNKFSLGGALNSDDVNEVFDDVCKPMIQSSGLSSDYLMLPPGMVIVSHPQINANFFCGDHINGLTVIGDPIGPITIIFNSDNFFESDKEIGFQIDYSFV
ncbi:hypothetical protein ACFFRR_008511 [Megaselia abdita]